VACDPDWILPAVPVTGGASLACGDAGPGNIRGTRKPGSCGASAHVPLPVQRQPARRAGVVGRVHDPRRGGAAEAGLPPIKLHEGRHSAASLARDAEVDPEIRRKTLGHADQAMTSHYTHIEAQAHRAAAEMVAKLVEEAGS
jgi:integrase